MQSLRLTCQQWKLRNAGSRGKGVRGKGVFRSHYSLECLHPHCNVNGEKDSDEGANQDGEGLLEGIDGI